MRACVRVHSLNHMNTLDKGGGRRGESGWGVRGEVGGGCHGDNNTSVALPAVSLGQNLLEEGKGGETEGEETFSFPFPLGFPLSHKVMDGRGCPPMSLCDGHVTFGHVTSPYGQSFGPEPCGGSQCVCVVGVWGWRGSHSFLIGELHVAVNPSHWVR